MIAPSKNFFSLLITIFFLAGIVRSQETYTLSYGFAKGETYRYRSINNNTFTNDMNGNVKTSTTRSESVTRIVIENLTSQRSFVCISVMDSFLLNGKPASFPANSFVGKRMRVTLSPLGELERREVIDTVQSSGFGTVPQRETIILHRFPAKPIERDSSWTVVKNDTMPMFGTTMIMSTTTTYTLRGTETKNGKKCIKVTYAGNGTTTGSGSPMGTTTTMQGTSSSEGTIYFDAKKCFVLFEEGTTNVNSTISASNGMTISMLGATTVTHSLIE